MKCPVNADCDHEEKINKLCGETKLLKAKPGRKEIYTVIAICAIVCLGWLAYNWLEVEAKADETKLETYQKEVRESLHRQELTVKELSTVVTAFIKAEEQRCKDAKTERDENKKAIRENERRLDRIAP